METSLFLARVIGLVGVISTATILVRYKEFLALEAEAANSPLLIHLSGFVFMHDDRTAKLAERYNLEAVAYHELWAPVLRIAGHRLLRELSGAEIRRAIDVGAGVGSLFEDLRAAFPGAFVLGCDRSPGMLRLAPDGMPRTIADARQLPVSSGTVDLALLVFVLFHLERPVEALREARRVLRTGGRLGTVTWGGNFESRATRVWTECLDAHGAAPSDAATQARHDAVDTPEKMAELLRTAGFTSIQTWAENLISVIDLEHLLSLKTRLGGDKPRFDSLDVTVREACIAAARCRLTELAAEDFIANGNVVYAVAT